jgi:hypothetical protein
MSVTALLPNGLHPFEIAGAMRYDAEVERRVGVFPQLTTGVPVEMNQI